jgi:hypothetical protein
MTSWRGCGQLYLSSCGTEIVELANRIGYYWMDDRAILIHPVVIINKDGKWSVTTKLFITYVHQNRLGELMKLKCLE